MPASFARATAASSCDWRSEIVEESACSLLVAARWSVSAEARARARPCRAACTAAIAIACCWRAEERREPTEPPPVAEAEPTGELRAAVTSVARASARRLVRARMGIIFPGFLLRSAGKGRDYNRPEILRLERTRGARMGRIGVLTGGGDCPGLNAAIRAVVRKGTTA